MRHQTKISKPISALINEPTFLIRLFGGGTACRLEHHALQTKFSILLPVVGESPMDEFICQATHLTSGM